MHGFKRVAGQVAEEVVLLALADHVVEGIVPPVHHATAEQAPFGNDNPFLRSVHSPIGEGIADDDVFAEQIAYAFKALRFDSVGEEGTIVFSEDVKEPFATGGGIVGEEFDAIDATDREHGVFLIFQLRVLPLFDKTAADAQLAPENLRQEIPIAAGGFQKAAVDALRLVLHEVKHGVHLALVGEDLAVLLHTGARLHLFGCGGNHKCQMIRLQVHQPIIWHDCLSEQEDHKKGCKPFLWCSGVQA